jgi:short-subunit dehydrogenase
LNERKNCALVTGASSGIGLAISGELAKRGHSLLMVSNEDERLAEAARELQSMYGINAAVLCMDLAQNDSAQKLFNYCQENHFEIEILVNNAGIFFFRDVIDTPPNRMETMINLHVFTPVMLTRIFAQQAIADNRKAYILNMASISSRMMMPGIALYSSTKSFLRCFSRSMRHEVFDKGVSITTISPGAVATSLYNLSSRYLKLGVRLGVILTPERLAQMAVKKMFQRKPEYIPGGFINRLFILLVAIMPEVLIRKLKKKIDKLQGVHTG